MRSADARVDQWIGIGLDQRQRSGVEATLAREESEAAPPAATLRPDMVAQRDGLGARVVAKESDDAGAEPDRRLVLAFLRCLQTVVSGLWPDLRGPRVRDGLQEVGAVWSEPASGCLNRTAGQRQTRGVLLVSSEPVSSSNCERKLSRWFALGCWRRRPSASGWPTEK
jgi:hypothetical protein